VGAFVARVISGQIATPAGADFFRVVFVPEMPATSALGTRYIRPYIAQTRGKCRSICGYGGDGVGGLETLALAAAGVSGRWVSGGHEDARRSALRARAINTCRCRTARISNTIKLPPGSRSSNAA
jgi:hypothetical protein